MKVLEHVAERVEKEMTEERSDMVASTSCEPIFDLIHGIPGAGKSKVIAWICELFTDVLGWVEHNSYAWPYKIRWQPTSAATRSTIGPASLSEMIRETSRAVEVVGSETPECFTTDASACVGS